ncbi:hypothetical protein Tco_0959983, partial [Tanacetum coccineum]
GRDEKKIISSETRSRDVSDQDISERKKVFRERKKCEKIHAKSIWEVFRRKARDLGSIQTETGQNTTFQACDFHFDGITINAQEVKFLIKIVTSQTVETVSKFTMMPSGFH